MPDTNRSARERNGNDSQADTLIVRWPPPHIARLRQHHGVDPRTTDPRRLGLLFGDMQRDGVRLGLFVLGHDNGEDAMLVRGGHLIGIDLGR